MCGLKKHEVKIADDKVFIMFEKNNLNW